VESSIHGGLDKLLSSTTQPQQCPSNVSTFKGKKLILLLLLYRNHANFWTMEHIMTPWWKVFSHLESLPFTMVTTFPEKVEQAKFSKSLIVFEKKVKT